MEHKAFTTTDFKSDPSGAFTATFSLWNTPDADQDVTLPGAFTDGAVVPVSAWGHSWASNPTGVATIRTNSRGAQAVGKFFTDTTHGLDAYRTVKGLAEQGRGQWSYGFQILDSEMGTWDGKPVRLLKRLQVFEVSPVIAGSQILSSTDAIKGRPLTRLQRELRAIHIGVLRRDITRLQSGIAQLEEIEAARERFIARGWMKR